MSILPRKLGYRKFPPSGIPPWKRILRRVGKQLLAWKYRRFEPDSEPDTTVRIAGLRLYVLRGVFNPGLHFTSGVLASYIKKPGVIRKSDSVLDLGTGTGVIALTAALSGPSRVVATDINPEAVRCAQVNVKRYGLERVVTVREGDMFAATQGERFDLVLCNPPYFRGEPASMAERAFRAGPALEWITQFARELNEHLSPSGGSIISLGDAADIPAIVKLLEEQGWSCVQVAQRDKVVEVVYVFRLTRTKSE
jgi:release factor glutamine methyltransferase